MSLGSSARPYQSGSSFAALGLFQSRKVLPGHAGALADGARCGFTRAWMPVNQHDARMFKNCPEGLALRWWWGRINVG